MRCVLATHNYFETLGVSAAIGRLFTSDVRTAVEAPVAVISDGLWKRRFGSSTGALGQKLTVANRVYTSIGVAPRSFSGIDIEPVDV